MATLSHSHAPQYLQNAIITDSNYYEMLYTEHRDSVYRVALRVTHNAADAEDVVQNVFLRMLRNDSQPDPDRSPGAYLKRAAKNASIDLIRQRTQRAETTIPVYYQAPADAHVERRQIQQAVEQLPPHNAHLFEMHYRDGYMCVELAELLDMQSGTVKSRLHRIRATLQKQLQAA